MATEHHAMTNYRNQLQESLGKVQDDYDKAILTLSTAAIGLSIVFIKDIVPTESFTQYNSLVGAWVLWVASLTSVLISFYASFLSIKKTIKQVDEGTIYSENTGGFWTKVTHFLNLSSGLCFVIGVALFLFFVITITG